MVSVVLTELLFYSVAHPFIWMTVTHRMITDTFAAILDLSTTYGKKRKRYKRNIATVINNFFCRERSRVNMIIILI